MILLFSPPPAEPPGANSWKRTGGGAWRFHQPASPRRNEKWSDSITRTRLFPRETAPRLSRLLSGPTCHDANCAFVSAYPSPLRNSFPIKPHSPFFRHLFDEPDRFWPADTRQLSAAAFTTPPWNIHRGWQHEWIRLIAICRCICHGTLDFGAADTLCLQSYPPSSRGRQVRSSTEYTNSAKVHGPSLPLPRLIRLSGPFSSSNLVTRLYQRQLLFSRTGLRRRQIGPWPDQNTLDNSNKSFSEASGLMAGWSMGFKRRCPPCHPTT